MNKQEAISELREIAEDSQGDREAAHMNADQVLCELLTSLGYADVVKEWYKVKKWYS